MHVLFGRSEKDADCRWPHSKTFIQESSLILKFLEIFIGEILFTFEHLFKLILDFPSNFRIFSQGIKCHTNQMSSCIDSCKIEGNQLLCNLLFCYFFQLVWFPFCFSLSDFGIDFFHLAYVVVYEIPFWTVWVVNTVVNNLENNLTNVIDQNFKLFVCFAEIVLGDTFFEKQFHNNILSGS